MSDGERLDRNDILSLVEAGRSDPHALLDGAHRVRVEHFGRAVALCSIAAGKVGGCSEDCTWCAQSVSRGTSRVDTSRTTSDNIHAAAREARGHGAGSFGIVNSGRAPAPDDLSAVAIAAEAISADAGCSLRVCASLGELTDEQARTLATSGVTRYNHNLETSRGFYPKVVTSHAYDDRLATLDVARNAGMSLCCGGIFGLGETWADRVDLAVTLRDRVQPAVVPLNFLHPIPGTPLADNTPLQPMEVLTIIAVFRLVLPAVDLKVAGGREVNLRDMQSWMFYAGATSCLIGNYLTTPGRTPPEDLQMIADLGMEVVPELPTPS